MYDEFVWVLSSLVHQKMCGGGGGGGGGSSLCVFVVI
jgi:hypothetical protein